MKTIINKIFCYILLFVTISRDASFAQGDRSTETKVSASLLNNQGKPMNYATVTLIRLTDSIIVNNDDAPYNFENMRSRKYLITVTDSTIVKGTLSNDDDIYTFKNICPGKYLIEASVIDYSKAVTSPFIISDNTATFIVPTLNMRTGRTALQILA